MGVLVNCDLIPTKSSSSLGEKTAGIEFVPLYLSMLFVVDVLSFPIIIKGGRSGGWESCKFAIVLGPFIIAYTCCLYYFCSNRHDQSLNH